jgi:phospholipase/lecithinase/hemolysin
MPVLPGDNYAVAGATTGQANSNDGVLGLTYPGLQDQIGEFLASQPAEGIDSGALYVVWAGANDFFALLQSGGSPATVISSGVNNTVQALQALHQAGARHILILNLPDLGVTPFGSSSGNGGPITQLCAAYNQVLETTLEAVADAGVPTIRVDAFTTLQTMAGLPAQFGFTNVTEPFLTTGGNPDRFLFWDAVHPATRGHEILANQARNDLVDYHSPRNGKSEPPALVNSLNGLVRTHRGVP